MDPGGKYVMAPGLVNGLSIWRWVPDDATEPRHYRLGVPGVGLDRWRFPTDAAVRVAATAYPDTARNSTP